MAAVRKDTCVSPGKVTDHSDIRPPTDVMAITSLPKDPSRLSGLRFPFERPTANRYYLSQVGAWLRRALRQRSAR